jgi:two-component sensor histidine kinase
MGPYAGRVQVEGPSLMLTAKAAQSFALALHELATNAAKYGALSNATGRVHISWSKLASNGSKLFTFRWQEEGGIAFPIAGMNYELNGSLDALTTDTSGI